MIGQSITSYNSYNNNIFNNYNYRYNARKSNIQNNQVNFSGGAMSTMAKNVTGAAKSVTTNCTPKLNWFERFCAWASKATQFRTEGLKATTGKAMAAPAAIACFPSKKDGNARAYAAALQPVEGVIRFLVFLVAGLILGRAAGSLAAKGAFGKFFTEGALAKSRVGVLKDTVTVGGTLLCVPFTAYAVDKSHPIIVPKIEKGFAGVKNFFKGIFQGKNKVHK